MKHLLDGWPLDDFDGDRGRKVTDGSSVAGSRPAVDVSDVSLPGRRGKVPSFFGAPGEAVYTVEVVCFGASYVDAREMVAELHARLPVHRLVNLEREDAGLSVFAPGRVLAASDVSGVGLGNHALRVKFVFSIPGGVWLDTVEQTATVPAGTSVIAALTGGSAPMEARFTITGNGSATNVRITDADTGAWWSLVGNVPVGTPVTVDPLAHTATAGATTYSHLLTVGDRPFYVSPGAVLTQVRNGPQETKIMARRSWYE